MTWPEDESERMIEIHGELPFPLAFQQVAAFGSADRYVGQRRCVPQHGQANHDGSSHLVAVGLPERAFQIECLSELSSPEGYFQLGGP